MFVFVHIAYIATLKTLPDTAGLCPPVVGKGW